jgi:leucyl-tRNA synthetase
MYDHKEIEKKWNKKWEDEKLYKTKEDFDLPKYYILDMFPYPSGAGLHVGHPKGFIATDIFCRMKILQGFNVLHPMGWDAFGLPAENYAIKNKVHPKVATEKNINTFKEQLKKIGFTYDWDREINTTDPGYYKWTQWIFLEMFKRGLAYESYEPINWCPDCQTGLANEDLEDGKCERCGAEIERKPMRQWVLKITDYADRLQSDLDKLPEWEEAIKEMQKNWIGRSEGATVKFKVISKEKQTSPQPSPYKGEGEYTLEVFTTRPDTLFGCTYMVVAPEHPLITNYEMQIKNYDDVKKYIDNAKKKSDLERTELQKEKTGIKLEGLAAINPVNNEEIPIYLADYVMMGYGTGAIMAVPAHDQRDFEFAEKYDITIKQVVAVNEGLIKNNLDKSAYEGDGININSDFLDGLATIDAKKTMIKWLEEKGVGQRSINYKLKDWVFSRQRYWGEPIPLIHCGQCGVVAVPEKDLPVLLPDVEHYEPTGTGESPLANITDWVNTTCQQCGGPAKRETNTMPQWAGSSWYYLRYEDPHNDKALVDIDKEKYWSPIDFYVGGAEHATRHLIYARFWHKFLFDIGVVNYDEPFKRLQHVGLILAEDGRKMSKRWGNVINPDDIVAKFGADALRIYEMFMGPFSQPCAWNTNGLIGARRFLEKVYKIAQHITHNAQHITHNKEVEKLLHKTIKKVSEDIEQFKFNTAISQMMIFINEIEKTNYELRITNYELFIKILSPFAPFLAEEIWSSFALASSYAKNSADKSEKYNESIFKQKWPDYNPELAKDETIELVIQVNGKVRDNIEVSAEIGEDEAKDLAVKSEKVKKWIDGKEIVKIIFVKGKLVNIVIK